MVQFVAAVVAIVAFVLGVSRSCPSSTVLTWVGVALLALGLFLAYCADQWILPQLLALCEQLGQANERIVLSIERTRLLHLAHP